MTIRTGLAALALLAAMGGWAQAEEADAKTDPADIAALDRCLKAAGDDPRSCIGTVSNACQTKEGGSTTPGIADCHLKEAAVWDRLLNDRYKALMASTQEGAKDAAEQGITSDAVADLRDAQRKWVAFRDAECDRIYSYYATGTIRIPASAYCQLSLTAERAIDLAPEDP